MSRELDFIAALRAIATSPAARGLADDAAVLEIGGARLVLTMDAIVEGVHFLPDDPPQDVAWKLVATNVSDLAAKGARPLGALLTYPLASDPAWVAAFLEGLGDACATFAIALLGGDTVRQPEHSARSFSLVALGEATGPVPSRSGARPGDHLWVSAPIGDAGLGLSVLRGEQRAKERSRTALVGRYRRPTPDVALGIALAPLVSAMMDVSDGLLIDASRLGVASDLGVVIDLALVPLSQAFAATLGDELNARLFAAGAGDDYCLLLAAPPSSKPMLKAAAAGVGVTLYRVGRVMAGRGLTLLYQGEAVPLPTKLGYEH